MYYKENFTKVRKLKQISQCVSHCQVADGRVTAGSKSIAINLYFQIKEIKMDAKIFNSSRKLILRIRAT